MWVLTQTRVFEFRVLLGRCNFRIPFERLKDGWNKDSLKILNNKKKKVLLFRVVSEILAASKMEFSVTLANGRGIS